jgi:hypothetical protein
MDDSEITKYDAINFTENNITSSVIYSESPATNYIARVKKKSRIKFSTIRESHHDLF